MGAPVTGDPDLYSVYQSRIYIFGSEGCKKKFDAAPEKYLESEGGAQPKLSYTTESLQRGQLLIDKAVGALGGASLIDSLASYKEKTTARQTRQQGDVEVRTETTLLFPDRSRVDQSMPDWSNASAMRQGAIIIAAGEAFAITPNGVRSLPEAARIAQESELKRQPLSILRARKSAGFKPVAVGSGNAGETAVEQVAVELDGTVYTLGIDPASGRVLSLSYRRRGPGGDYGQLTKVFSDFRAVSGLILPFKVTTAFADQLWKEQSATVESITVNGKVDPALFEKPKTDRTQ